jgi:hypothetical protein
VPLVLFLLGCQPLLRDAPGWGGVAIGDDTDVTDEVPRPDDTGGDTPSTPDDTPSTPDDTPSTPDDTPAVDTDVPALPLIRFNELVARPGPADPFGADWLELVNLGGTAVDLEGWGLSDDPFDPFDHTLPAGTSIGPGEHLLFLADGTDAVGHLPFALSGGGEALVLADAAGRVVDRVAYASLDEDAALSRIPDGTGTWELVSAGTPGAPNARLGRTTLRVLAPGTAWSWSVVPPVGDWFSASYVPSAAWTTSFAPIGYGDDQASMPDVSAGYPLAMWARATFDMPAFSATSATLSLRVDDGAIVWIDGTEVLRLNLPPGPISPDTLATATITGDDERTFFPSPIDAAVLTPGTHTIAVEFHQVSPSSSDLTMDLSIDAEALVATP